MTRRAMTRLAIEKTNFRHDQFNKTAEIRYNDRRLGTFRRLITRKRFVLYRIHIFHSVVVSQESGKWTVPNLFSLSILVRATYTPI